MAIDGDNDRGKLALGEKQVRAALEKSKEAELRIALLHHPFDWLYEFDWETSENLLMDKCHFILRGHVHRSALSIQNTPDTKAFTIVAGSCYETRTAQNGYNYVQLNTDNNSGNIILRAWSNTGGGFWTKDVMTYRNLDNGTYPFELDSYLEVTTPGGDSLKHIEAQFTLYTDRAIRNIETRIPGLADPIPRDEVSYVEDQIRLGNSVLLTGDAGTGKSGIASILARNGLISGYNTLLLDARLVGHIHDDTQLRQQYDLKSSLYSAIKRLGTDKGCRLVIDQLDNIAGSPSASILIELALEVHTLEGVEVIVVSRKREGHEQALLQKLMDNNFIELTSHPLTEINSKEILELLGISEPSVELVAIGKNLLNLQLIGKIKEHDTEFDFSTLTDEVILWDTFIKIFLAREVVGCGPSAADSIIEEAVKLARDGLIDNDRMFILPIQMTFQQIRLISASIIINSSGRSYQFYHEKLQDYLYAWEATQRKLMPETILADIPEHRTRNILIWMEKIYLRESPDLHAEFLERSLQ